MGILAELFTTGDVLLSEDLRQRYAMEDAELRKARYEKDWDESKHPRDGGKFAPKGGGDDGGREGKPTKKPKLSAQTIRDTLAARKAEDEAEPAENEKTARIRSAIDKRREKLQEQLDNEEINEADFDLSMEVLENHESLLDDYADPPDQSEERAAQDAEHDAQFEAMGEAMFARETQLAEQLEAGDISQGDYDQSMKALEPVRKSLQEIDDAIFERDNGMTRAEWEKDQEATQAEKSAASDVESLRSAPDKKSIQPFVERALAKIAMEGGGDEKIGEFLQSIGWHEKYAKRFVERYAKDARWITINAGDGGGTPVKVDGSGKIVAGPSGLAKKGVKSLDDFGKKKGKADAKPKKPDADAKARSKGFKDAEDQKRFEDAAKRHEDGVSQEAGFKDSADEKRFEQSLKPAGKSDWLKSLPRFQRQMVEELWEKHLEKNPKASRADFEESLRGDSRKANQKPKPEKPARQPAKKPPKPKPKKDPQDNLWPYVGLDRTPEPEPTYTEMTEFDPDDPPTAPEKPVPPSDDRRLGLKLKDLDDELDGIAAQAEAEKQRRRANKASLFETFKTWMSSLMKKPLDEDFGEGSLGKIRSIVAKSLHAKKGKREQYQRQAFNRFLGEVARHGEEV